MKKQSLLLITGGLLAMASCNTEPAANADDAQAKIDSMVNERVEQIRMELQAQNDSLINAMAMYRADSIIAARSGKKAPAKPKAAPSTGIDKPAEAPTSEAPKETTTKSKWDTNKEEGTSSKSKWGNKEEGTSSGSKWK